MSNQFQNALCKVTDQLLVDIDWVGTMDCIDMIRGKNVSTKDAAALIARRLQYSNPNIVHHTLVFLEACMKNCGTAFHAEIMSTRFLDQLKDIVITSSPGKVQEKTLELIQVWHSAFAKRQEYAAISDVHRILKLLGYKFPVAKESDAMFFAQCAPDWVDGDHCFRCRSGFGFFNKKHNCRACGQTFCDRCSRGQLILPHFGMERKVRVCDTCYEQNIKKKTTQKFNKGNILLQRELQLREEEELALAIALSQSEAEHKNHQVVERTPVAETNTPSNDGNESMYKGDAMSVIDDRPLPTENFSVDSNLAHYLNRDYWQKKSTDNSANAPPPSDISYSSTRNGSNNIYAVLPNNLGENITKQNVDPVFSLDPITKKFQNIGFDEDEAETRKTKEFCDQIRERIDIMDNRMRSNLMRNRSIVNDSAIHGLFVQLTDMHGDVLERLHTLENNREYYERLQDHLAHIQESRQAVNALREEHERQRQERLLAEQRERQAQMQQKLAIMRIKKHEMLLDQRQIALQRFQQQDVQRCNNLAPQVDVPPPQQQQHQQQYMIPNMYQQGYPFPPVSQQQQPPHQQPQSLFMMPQNMYPSQGYQFPSSQLQPQQQQHPMYMNPNQTHFSPENPQQ